MSTVILAVTKGPLSTFVCKPTLSSTSQGCRTNKLFRREKRLVFVEDHAEKSMPWNEPRPGLPFVFV